MSVGFSASGQLLYIDSDTDIDQESFTVLGQFKLTSDVSCALITLDTTAGRMHELWYDSTTGQLQVRENYSDIVATIGSVEIDEWFLAGLRGEDPGTTRMRLHGFFVRSGGAVNAAYVDSPQYLDSLNLIYLGAGTNNASDWLRGRVADVHVAKRTWTDGEIAAQALQQAAYVSGSLVCSAYLDGGSLAAAKTSDVANETYASSWTTPGGGSDPAYSSDAPSYAPGAVTLAGGWTMPSTMPSIGIDVVQAKLVPAESALFVEATLDAAPTPGNMLVVDIGGFIGGGGAAVEITDNQRALSPLPANEYEEQILAQAGTTGIWSGKWTLRVPADAVTPFTIRATPDSGGSPSWLTICISEVRQVDTVTPVLSTPNSNTGTSAAPSVSTGSIGSQPALILGGVSWLSSVNTAAPGSADYKAVRGKDGAAGLHVVKRRITLTGTYSPAWTLNASDSWVATALVLKEASSTAVTPTVTTTSLPAGTAGAVYGPVTLSATGTGPFTWSVPSGSLPSGLGLDVSVGVIGGALAAAAATETFTVRATGPTGLYDDQVLTLTVGTRPVFVTTSLPAATVGVAYSETIDITGANSQSLVGALPDGLEFDDDTATISGTPTAAATRSFDISATNSYGTTTQRFVLTVNATATTGTSGGWSRWLGT